MCLCPPVRRYIVTRDVIIQFTCETASDDREILVQRVVRRVDERTEHTVYDRRILAPRHMAVYLLQFGLIHLYILQHNPFGMLQKEYINEWYTCFAAGAVIISIPIAILFIYMQRFYVNGMSGAVKG